MKKKTVITTEKREVWVIRQQSGEASPGDVMEQDPVNATYSSHPMTMPNDEFVKAQTLTEEQKLEPE